MSRIMTWCTGLARTLADRGVCRRHRPSRSASRPTPGAAKRLGRRVVGFDEQEWARRRFGIVVTGNLAKFSQHPGLLGTGGKVLGRGGTQ
jgi:predicted NAD-dependent protein-ADP-ribosyltransferase YbiA (DUF1768 family)